MFRCDVCDTWYHVECVELEHTIAHYTVVYVCHLCIKKTFSHILQYHRYNINCFLNSNSGDPVLALLKNFALLSKDKIRSFTLLKLPINDFEKMTQKIHIHSFEPQTCRGIANHYNSCYISASIQILLGSCRYNFPPAKNSLSSEF